MDFPPLGNCWVAGWQRNVYWRIFWNQRQNYINPVILATNYLGKYFLKISLLLCALLELKVREDLFLFGWGVAERWWAGAGVGTCGCCCCFFSWTFSWCWCLFSWTFSCSTMKLKGVPPLSILASLTGSSESIVRQVPLGEVRCQIVDCPTQLTWRILCCTAGKSASVSSVW